MKKEADMIHPIANAPCSWGVDDPKNPNLPAWATVLKEAAQAGYRSIELGPWGYLPTDPASLRAALEQHQLSLVAGGRSLSSSAPARVVCPATSNRFFTA